MFEPISGFLLNRKVGNKRTDEKLDNPRTLLPPQIIEQIASRKRVDARRRVLTKVSMVASIVGALFIWWVLSETFLTKVPSPAETLKWSLPLISDPWFYNSVLASMSRVYLGFVLGIIAGTFVGMMMGWKERVRIWTFPGAEILRHIPPISWVPLSIIVTASLTPSIIMIIFIGTFFATALNAMLGVRSIDRSVIRAAICLGANQKQMFRHILLPGSLPSILYGMVLGMGLAWMSVVAGEMISGDYGIGYLAWQSYNLIRFPEIILAMLTIGGLAYGSSEVVRYFVGRFLKWRQVYT